MRRSRADLLNRVSRRRLPLLVFALVWFSCAWFGSWEWNPNTAVRMFAAISLVEDGDATIDEFAALTVDKARFDGHAYSDKAPGMTIMALVPIALADALTGETKRDVSIGPWHPETERFLKLRTRMAATLGPALLTALAAIALLDLGTGLTGSARAGLVAAIGYALATPVWGWSTTMFGHSTVAAMLAIAAWAIWRGSRDDVASSGHALVAGLALGWAAVVEHPAAIFGLILGLWALLRLRGKTGAMRAILFAVVGGAVALLPFVAYNLIAFGEPFRIGYAGVVGWEGMQTGLFGLTYPRAEPLWGVTLGLRRGMLWVAPVIVPGAIGLAMLICARGTRDIGIAMAALAIAAFLYNASYVYWDGGNSTGPRHAVPALGALALGLAAAWAQGGRAGRLLLIATTALSAAINLVVASTETMSGGQGPFPLWDDVFARFRDGEMRTIGNEYLGLTPWQGLSIWAAVATFLLWMTVRTAQRLDSTREAVERI